MDAIERHRNEHGEARVSLNAASAEACSRRDVVSAAGGAS